MYCGGPSSLPRLCQLTGARLISFVILPPCFELMNNSFVDRARWRVTRQVDFDVLMW